jgi:CubicO group peptidase (beta-lactamase class C family)
VAVVARSHGPIQVAYAGVRNVLQSIPVERDDAFHLASVSKPMTATLAALLVEDGVMDWTTSLGDAVPTMEEEDDAREITAELLLTHRSGLPSMTSFSSDQAQEIEPLLNAPPAMQRLNVTGWLMRQRGRAEPGERFIYSNGGYVALAAVMEARTDKPFETLMGERLFGPLNMRHAGFGWPASAMGDAAPWGHSSKDGHWTAHSPEEWRSMPPAFAPASDVHASATDVGRFLREHLRGLRGLDGLLRSAVIRQLHEPRIAIGDDQASLARPILGRPLGYAGGWVIFEGADGTRASWHNGTAGTFFAWATVVARSNVAIGVLVNAGQAERVCAQVTKRVLNEIRRLGTQPPS